MPLTTIQRFESFFNATSDCQFYVTPDDDGNFRYVHVNPAALAATRWTDERDLIGLTPVEALGVDYGTTVEANIVTAYRHGRPHHFKGRLGSADDAPVYDALYIPLKDDSGTVAGILGTARNISEVHLLNERLLHAQRLEALGELVGSVAHDFKNILMVCHGALRFLAHDGLEPDKKRSIWSEAQQALASGTALTQRLTAFARKEKIVTCPCDVNELVSASLLMIKRVLGNQITLAFSAPGDLWHAQCDPNEFEIALMNIASNARDAMNGVGRVTIVGRNGVRTPSDPASYPAAFVEITVTDEGCGMPATVARRALEPFFTTKPRGEGTGLGLSSVAKFVEDIGGGLRIQSELGRGTSLALLLPKAAE